MNKFTINQIKDNIENNNFVRNNYNSFIESYLKGKRNSFLTHYTKEDFEDNNVQTFQVPNIDAGFALKYDENDGETDIISLHNNSGIKGLGDLLIDAAIRNGGTKCDHFDGFLSNLYKQHNLQDKEHWQWNDEYAPEDWDYNTYGTPDVVLRHHEYETPEEEELAKTFGMDKISRGDRYNPNQEDFVESRKSKINRIINEEISKLKNKYK